LGKNIPNSFFLGKKENLKIFLKKLSGKHGPQSQKFFFKIEWQAWATIHYKAILNFGPFEQCMLYFHY